MCEVFLEDKIVSWMSHLLSSPDRAASNELFPQPTFPTTTTREPCSEKKVNDKKIMIMKKKLNKVAHFTLMGGMQSL